jgi:hyperpolarization activated cyclic nucleotide-gated potassium channel 1
LTPIDLAFPDIRDGDDNFNGFMYAIDIIFLCDLISNFFSAFEDEKMILVDDLKKIILAYLKGWFFIDFLSIFPLDIIL